MTKLAVFVSGTGTILEAMIHSGLEISLVLADRPCRGLEIAKAAGIAIELVERKTYGPDFDRAAYTREVMAALEPHDIGLIAMAGFMTILAPAIFDRYEGKILNTHPSLLPAFKGENAVEQALAAGVKTTGFTIHIATSELDAGPILTQTSVPVEPGDTIDTLQERIKQSERRVYPETIKKLMSKASPV